MATKKKTPFIVKEEAPKEAQTSGTSQAVGLRPVQKIDLTNDPVFKQYAEKANERADVEAYKKATPRFDRDALVLPDGRRLTGTFDELNQWREAYLNLKGLKNPEVAQAQKAEIQAELDKTALKKKMEAEQTAPRVTEQQINELTQLTPEQQQLAQSDPRIKGGFDFRQLGALTAERATIGATTVGAAGLLGGPAAPVTVPVAAGLGALGGAGTALFSTFKDTTVENVKQIDENVRNAKSNLVNARTIANKGGSYEEVKTIVGESLAQLDLAERQYKEQSKKLFEYKSDAKVKLRDLQMYKEQVLPGSLYRIELALQKPAPEYINTEMGGVE